MVFFSKEKLKDKTGKSILPNYKLVGFQQCPGNERHLIVYVLPGDQLSLWADIGSPLMVEIRGKGIRTMDHSFNNEKVDCPAGQNYIR